MQQSRQLPFQVPPSSLFPPRVSTLVRPLDPVLTRLFFKDRLLERIPPWSGGDLSSVAFAREFLQNLAITYRLADGDLERVPSHGPVLLVANHPFGFLEGLLLLSFLDEVRPDFRVVANTFLASVPAVRERVISINPFGGATHYENGPGLRSSLQWLSQGGLLVMFPAGEVSHLHWAERSVVDPEWNTTAARLAAKIGCPTVPLFFDGTNSHRFQMVGTLHPRLRTLNLLNELLNKSSSEVEIRIGTPVSAATLAGFGDAAQATAYLRARTYLLRDRPPAVNVAVRSPLFLKPKPVAPPVAPYLLAEEMEAVPDSKILARNADFKVCLVSKSEAPNTLREIGRCRELTYREVGEGTGRALDLDAFDDYYQHLVLWHAADRRVAGAYRLAATPDVLPVRGIEGLYSATLFHYSPEFFQFIGPAIELGRSFICRDYQKLYSPLLLLWKGIINYVAQRPECAVLFGAVSMSSDYHSLSRTLLVNFLNGHVATEVSHWIRPRRAFRGRPLLPKHVKQLSRLLPTVEELSASIQDLEADGKGLPILIRQYLKVGGQLLGFNVDPSFSNALDVLVMADLRTASGPMLDRCLGKEGAASFRAWHSRKKSDVPVA